MRNGRSTVWKVGSVVFGFMLALGGCGDSSDPEPPPTAHSARCGDAHVDLGEQCDGADMAGRTCATYGLGVEGELHCRSDCTLDAAGCRNGACGNGRVDLLNSALFGSCEQCDGTDLGGASCEGFGGHGALQCAATCTIDRTVCDDVCFNGRLEPGEACDFDPATYFPILPDGATCESLGLGAGQLSCTWGGGSVVTPYGTASILGCTVAPYGCERFGNSESVCGDGVKSGFFEECDGADLGGITCEALGLTGTLRCGSSCRFDYADCGFAPGPEVCGDGVIQAGEECDETRFAPVPDGPAATQALACIAASVFSTGVPVCRDCRLDLSRCGVSTPACGDGVAQQYEPCDGDDVRGVTCADLGGTGNLRCTPWCTLDRAECRDVGGNGRREEGEPCDFGPFGTNDVGGATCTSLGFGEGDLSCGAFPRSYPTSLLGQREDPVLFMRVATWGCEGHGICGDGHATDFEECDGSDLGGASCATFDATGTLRCSDACSFDLTGCRSAGRCGNGHIDFGEECDPGAPAKSCAADGGSGEYRCDPEFCFVDTTGCSFTCPGLREPD